MHSHGRFLQAWSHIMGMSSLPDIRINQKPRTAGPRDEGLGCMYQAKHDAHGITTM